MTIEQKIPQAVPVAQGQITNGVTAINNRDNRIESAAFGFKLYSVDSTSETLTSAEFWEGAYLQLTAGSPAPGGPVTLYVPVDDERGIFTVYNNCGQTVTVTIPGQPVPAPTLTAGNVGSFISDGINVRTAAGSSGTIPVIVVPFRLTVAVSDELTALEAGVAKVTFRMSDDVDLVEVRASLRTGSASGAVVVDINENGTSILSVKLSVDVGEKTSLTAAVLPVISDGSIANDAEMTIDIDLAGADANGLKVTFIGNYT